MNEHETNVAFRLLNQSDTEILGSDLAAVAGTGDAFFLHGSLGIGKSVLARAFIRAYCQTNEDIPSPTFTLVQTYDMGPVPIFHFDLYRLQSANEILELGIEEAFADGISLVEWPDRLGEWLPANRLEIHIFPGNDEASRKINLIGFGYWKNRIVEKFGYKTRHVYS